MDEELKKMLIAHLEKSSDLLQRSMDANKTALNQIEALTAENNRLQMLLVKETSEKEYLRLVLKDLIFGTNSFGEAN